MGAVFLTGATGFVGREILSRFLERGDLHIFALVRAENDDQAAARLPAHDRLTAVAGDIEQPELGLSDGTNELLRREVFHLVAGRNATTVGRLLEMSSEELGRAEPTVLSPRLYRRWVHPWLRRKYCGLRRMEVYFPYFRDARALRRPAARPRPAGGGLLPPTRALRPGSGVGAEVGPTLVS